MAVDQRGLDAGDQRFGLLLFMQAEDDVGDSDRIGLMRAKVVVPDLIGGAVGGNRWDLRPFGAFGGDVWRGFLGLTGIKRSRGISR